MNISPVILIGMPGAGKTTMARQLADRYGRPYVDIDECIRENHGGNGGGTGGGHFIRELCENDPERFIELEAAELEAQLNHLKHHRLNRQHQRHQHQQDNRYKFIAIATGGSAPCHERTWDIFGKFAKHGVRTVWLDPDMEVILERILKDIRNGTGRYITGFDNSRDPTIDDIRNLYEARKDWYSRADVVIRGESGMSDYSSPNLSLNFF